MLTVVYQSRGRILLDEATATTSTIVSDQCKVGGTKLLSTQDEDESSTNTHRLRAFVRPKCAGSDSLKRRPDRRKTALTLIISD